MPAAHPKDCDCKTCIAEGFRESIPTGVVDDRGEYADGVLPAYQETLVADALVDLVAAWESKDPGHPDYIEPRLWLRRMDLSIGYARAVLDDVAVKDRRLHGDGAHPPAPSTDPDRLAA